MLIFVFLCENIAPVVSNRKIFFNFQTDKYLFEGENNRRVYGGGGGMEEDSVVGA